MPRNIASVPSVTTSDGRPSRVTSTPLKAPHSAPVASASADRDGQRRPRPGPATPKTTLDSARMLATDRSISRAMISSAIGMAISARSDTPAIACEMLKLVAKVGHREAA